MVEQRIGEEPESSPGSLHRLGLSCLTVVRKPVDEVEAGLREGADTWLPIVAYTAHRNGVSLLSRSGIKLFGRQRIRMIDAELADPFESEHGTTAFALNWRSQHGKRARFLRGTVEVAALDSKRTHFALNATYEPTSEVVGRLPDWDTTHHFAQTMLRDFSERIAHRLECGRLD